MFAGVMMVMGRARGGRIAALAAVVALSLSVSVPAVADGDLTIIRLNNRTAESLIPMLRSMYGNKIIVNGMGSKLFVEAPAATTYEIRKLIDSLDTHGRMLRVALRSPNQASAQSTRLAVNGTATKGPATVTVRNRAPAAGGGLIISNNVGFGGVQANQASLQQTGSSERYVIMEEGVPATITDANGTQMVVNVHGDTATVRVVAAPLSTDASALGTTVSGPVGQWMPLGGTQQSAETSGSGILSHSSDSGNSSAQYLLKITPVETP